MHPNQATKNLTTVVNKQAREVGPNKKEIFLDISIHIIELRRRLHTTMRALLVESVGRFTWECVSWDLLLVIFAEEGHFAKDCYIK